MSEATGLPRAPPVVPSFWPGLSESVIDTERVKGNRLMDAINTLFNNLLNIGLGVAVTVATFYLMVGAFLYMSASGSPHQMERGKSAILNALAGLAVVLAAKVIAGMIQSALGGG
jgi:hypothetical protein